MQCAISGELPNQPVLSTTTRLIYERSLIERAIAETGKCPVTGEAVSSDSLVAVAQPPVMRAKVAAHGPHGIISLLQKEWDDMALEVYSLRQQLELTRRELAQSLYQHDAACRVVARLMKERDEAMELLRSLKAQPHLGPSSAMEMDEAP
ncbi:hypothetical protein EON64_21390, partial [archaeon]